MASIFTTPLYARTSKLIYDHGETVQITIDGVTIGGKVVLSIADDPFNVGDNGIADTYKALTIVDGGKGDLDHVKNGVIVTNWKAPASRCRSSYPGRLRPTSGTLRAPPSRTCPVKS